MAFTCGFFNSQNGDRKYNAEQMASIFDGLIKDGVYDTVGDIFAVTPGTGMQVRVGSGRAWFDHTWSNNDAQYPLAITAADVSLPRYDAVVLETNHSDTVRTNRLRVLTGTPASNPAKPTMASSANVKQHPLAYIRVPAGATAIKQSMIQVVVGTSECPFVTGIIETAQIDALFQQWNGEFDEWFDNLKAQLSDNVVANLQNQINQKVNKSDVATTADINAGTSTTKWVTPKGLRDSGIDGKQIGDIVTTVRTNLGSNYVLANGDTVEQSTYPALVNILSNGVGYNGKSKVYTSQNAMHRIKHPHTLTWLSDPINNTKIAWVSLDTGYLKRGIIDFSSLLGNRYLSGVRPEQFGLRFVNGRYFLIAFTYASTGGNYAVFVFTSTDLVNWSVAVQPAYGYGSAGHQYDITYYRNAYYLSYIYYDNSYSNWNIILYKSTTGTSGFSQILNCTGSSYGINYGSASQYWALIPTSDRLCLMSQQSGGSASWTMNPMIWYLMENDNVRDRSKIGNGTTIDNLYQVSRMDSVMKNNIGFDNSYIYFIGRDRNDSNRVVLGRLSKTNIASPSFSLYTVANNSNMFWDTSSSQGVYVYDSSNRSGTGLCPVYKLTNTGGLSSIGNVDLSNGINNNAGVNSTSFIQCADTNKFVGTFKNLLPALSNSDAYSYIKAK